MVTRETSLARGLEQLGLGERGTDVDLAAARLAAYCDLLDNAAIPRGFVGPAEGPRLVERHVLEAAALMAFDEPNTLLVDVGSGAGLPGLVMSVLRRGETVLVEPREKRSAFLRRTASVLGVDVTVCSSTAEAAGRSRLRDSAALVVARALAPQPIAMELALPMARVGGRLAIPGDRVLAPGASESALQLGGADPEILGLAVPGAPEPAWVMIVRKTAFTPERYPRRPGIPRRRPLGGGVTRIK